MEKIIRMNRMDADGRGMIVGRMSSPTQPNILEVRAFHRKGVGNFLGFHVLEVSGAWVSFVGFDMVNFPTMRFQIDAEKRFNSGKMQGVATDENISACLEKFCVQFGRVNDWN